MKKILNAMVLTSMASYALHAYAEDVAPTSNITLYGIIDTAIRYTSHSNAKGENLWQVAGGTFQGSRLGLSGIENLGSGNSAFFVLENGFTPDNGVLGYSGRLFGRKAIVGLSSDTSTVQIGRDITLGFDTLQVYDSVTPMNNNTQLPLLKRCAIHASISCH